MSSKIALGSSKPVTTGIRKEISDRDATVIEVEGPYSALENIAPASFCPSGLTFETSSLVTTGDGMGKLTVRCVQYSGGMSFSAERTTFRIDMLEVQYDLEDHPHLKTARATILMWLATEESKRIDGESYLFMDKDGNLQPITEDLVKKFCNAYMSGIKTFYRYYPVIEKVSFYKNPPGMSMFGRSFTGGNPKFSRSIGTYDTPPLNLSGYSSTNWFKSKDSWVNNSDTTWTRTEQWTYTPEGSNGNHSWIYKKL